VNESAAAESVREERDHPAEAAPRRRRRRQRPGASAARVKRRRIRTVYFTLASVWGFVTGTVAILGVLSASGRPLTLEPKSGAVLGLATLVALLGGAVAARAYREVADRS